MTLRSLVLTVSLLVALPAAADELVLNNGAVFSGIVRERGDRVVIEMDIGTMTFKRSNVRSIIPSENPIKEYEKKRAVAADAKAHFELGTWAQGKGLKSRAREQFRKAIALDPDHEGARTALGYLKFDGKWMTEDEFMVARGFVKHGGEWLKRETVERFRENETRERIEVKRQETVRELAKMEADLEYARLALERELLKRKKRLSRYGWSWTTPAPGIWNSWGVTPVWPSPITPGPVQARPVQPSRPPTKLPPLPPWPSPISGRRP